MNIQPDQKMSPEFHCTKRNTSNTVHIIIVKKCIKVPDTILNLPGDNFK